MPKRFITETGVIEKYSVHEKVNQLDANADYIICQADALDSTYESELADKGFRFFDRILYMSIHLSKKDIDTNTDLKTMQQEQGIIFTSDEVFADSMYDMAYKVFTSDRRFHLDPVFNQQNAIPVIKAYIDQCQSKHMKIYKASHQDELLGYTIVNENADAHKCYFENVLGVTTPGIKGKMVAETLYRSMLAGERDNFREYVGRVSTSNIASMNLHFQLGAKVSSIYDEYIYKTNDNGGFKDGRKDFSCTGRGISGD